MSLDMLDVAIGVTFFFLMVSLAVTAFVEVIEAAVQMRSKHLERGVRSLLQDPTGEGLARRFYTHPLVKGLYVQRPAFVERLRVTLGRRPAALLSDDLPLDLAAAQDGAARARLDAGRLNTATARRRAEMLEAWRDWREAVVAAEEGPPGDEEAYRRTEVAYRKLGPFRSTAGVAATLPSYVPSGTFADTLLALLQEAAGGEGGRLRPSELAERLDEADLPDGLRRALRPLLLDAGADLARARRNLEGWFDAAMDRVAGWYKRYAQNVALGLGLGLAAVLNADALFVTRHLSQEDGVREALVTAAGAYVERAATAPDPAPAPRGTASPDTARTGTAGNEGAEAPADTAAGRYREARAQFDRRLADLAALGIPLGWGRVNPGARWPDRLTPGEHRRYEDSVAAGRLLALYRHAPDSLRPGLPEPALRRRLAAVGPESRRAEVALHLDRLDRCPTRACDAVRARVDAAVPPGAPRARAAILRDRPDGPSRDGSWWVLKVFGLLLTGIAVSLGAPFWFDVLNKFMVIRSTVKPHEKSLPEGSEDRRPAPGRLARRR